MDVFACMSIKRVRNKSYFACFSKGPFCKHRVAVHLFVKVATIRARLFQRSDQRGLSAQLAWKVSVGRTASNSSEAFFQGKVAEMVVTQAGLDGQQLFHGTLGVGIHASPHDFQGSNGPPVGLLGFGNVHFSQSVAHPFASEGCALAHSVLSEDGDPTVDGLGVGLG